MKNKISDFTVQQEESILESLPDFVSDLKKQGVNYVYTSPYGIKLDTQVLIQGANAYYGKKMLGVAEAYTVLKQYYIQPSVQFQRYLAPMHTNYGRLQMLERIDYPFVFCLEEVFRLQDVKAHGLCDLTKLLTKLNIPH